MKSEPNNLWLVSRTIIFYHRDDLAYWLYFLSELRSWGFAILYFAQIKGLTLDFCNTRVGKAFYSWSCLFCFHKMFFYLICQTVILRFSQKAQKKQTKTKTKKWASKPAQQGKLLPSSPVTCLIPGTHKNKGGNWLLQVVWFPHTHVLHVWHTDI